MLRSLYLLDDEANLPLYLKARISCIFPNDSLWKVRKYCDLALLSSHELMKDVSMFIVGVSSLSLCYMCIKINET